MNPDDGQWDHTVRMADAGLIDPNFIGRCLMSFGLSPLQYILVHEDVLDHLSKSRPMAAT